ncbi:MAG: rod shape-determining protein MreC [Clostridia bacterium]|nr:rod shape-determining protein MreC [Clostridia bacterium]
MKNLFQNKFMIVLIVIAILLVGTTSFISALGYTSYVRNAIGIVLTPVQKGLNFVFDGFEDIFSSKEKYNELKKENEDLKQQLAENQEALANAELALQENETLKEFFGIKEEHLDCSFENAKITGRQSTTYTVLYTINKGTLHGLTPGMPVIDKYGVLGCISEVGLTWAKVTPLTEPDVSLGAVVERTGETGICSGSFTASKKGLCVLSYLSKNTNIEVGDRIITSDDSAMFPKGMLIGTVETIETDSLTREKIAYIKPAADLENVNTVMVITEFEAAYE